MTAGRTALRASVLTTPHTGAWPAGRLPAGEPAIRIDADGLEALQERLAVPVGAAVRAHGAWTARLEGRRDSVRYAVQLAAAGSRPVPGGAVISGNGEAGAVSLVEDGVAGTCRLALAVHRPERAEATAAAMVAGRLDAALAGAPLWLLHEAGVAWAVLPGTPDAPPAALGPVGVAAPPPTAPAPRAARRRPGRWAVAAALALVAALALSLGIRAAGGRTPAPRPSASSVAGTPLNPPAGLPRGTLLVPVGLSDRSGVALAGFPPHGQVVAFGGRTSQGDSDETLLLQGLRWVPLRPALRPPARTGALLAFDPSSSQLLLFGGAHAVDADGDDALGDTWLWDGVRWSPSAATGPPAGCPGAMATDLYRSGLVLLLTCPVSLGGEQMWTWNGASWTRIHPAHLPPEPGVPAPMAADPVSTLLLTVVRSGTGTGQTWAWDGSDWRPAPVATPGDPGDGAQVAADPLHGAVVLVTGTGTSAPGTWVWSAGGWSVIPGTPPSGVVAVTDDGALPPLVVTRAPGGIDRDWRWTGSSWVQLT